MRLEINNTTKQKINTKILKQAADVFGKKMKCGKKQVSAAFVSGSKIQELNKSYRGLDKITDVLSFSAEEKDFLGEVVLCYPQIKKQARDAAVSAERELVFIFIHGLLHLVGYDDRSEDSRKEMIRIGNELTNFIVIPAKAGIS